MLTGGIGPTLREAEELYSFTKAERGGTMLGIILIVILVLALLGVSPVWAHSRNWGYAPTCGIGLILLIVMILLLQGLI